MIYKNKKNGKLYKQIAIGTDTTNCRDGTSVVIYCPCDDKSKISELNDRHFGNYSWINEKDSLVGVEANRFVENVLG